MLTLFAEGGEGEESFSEDTHYGATHNKPLWFLLRHTKDSNRFRETQNAVFCMAHISQSVGNKELAASQSHCQFPTSASKKK